MHVTHVNLSKELRGGEFQTAALVRALSGSSPGRPSQTVILRAGSRFHRYFEHLVAITPDMADVNLQAIRANFVKTIAAASSAAIVHIHEGRSTKVGAAMSLRGSKFVITRRIPKMPKDIFSTRWIYSRADRVVCVSAHIAQVMSAYLGASRVSVIHDCASTMGMSPSVEYAPANAIVRPLIVAAIGAISFRDKGQDLIVEVARQFAQRGEEVQFLIAGDGEDLDALRECTAGMENLRVLGWVDEVSGLLREAHLLLHPARVEGLGSVLLESMASGTPVLATSVGGIPEVVEDGRNGLLVEPDSVAALVEAIERCLAHPHLLDELSRQARQDANRYTATRMAEQYLAVYTDVLDPAQMN